MPFLRQGAPPPAKAFDLPSFLQIAQHPTHHIPTDAGTGLFQISERKRPVKCGNG